MKTHQRLLVFFLVAVLAVSFGYMSRAQSEEGESIRFPIADLGNCGSKDECRAYCGDESHHDACAAWARDNGLQHKSGQARPVARTGPGGCDSRQACDAFCRNPENASACIEFAVNEGRMTRDQADNILEAMRLRDQYTAIPRSVDMPKKPRVSAEPKIDVEKAKAILETQGGPGGCSSFNECEAFCNNPANEETCFQFAIDHELMHSADIERMQKLRSAEGPGGCRGRQCESYCEQPGHEEECIEFARKEGLMEEKEYHEVKKFLDAAKDGGPGGCRGRECESYCNNPEHQEECFAFAKEHGLMSAHEVEEIDRIRDTLKEGNGPGGCRSEEECHRYCSDGAHMEECTAFAADAGMMPRDMAEDMKRQFMEMRQADRAHMPSPSFEPQEGSGTLPPQYFEDAARRQFEDAARQQYNEEYQRRQYIPEGVDPPHMLNVPFEERPPQYIVPEGSDMPRDLMMPPEGYQPMPTRPDGFEQPQMVPHEVPATFEGSGEYTPRYESPPQPDTGASQTGASPFQIFLDMIGLQFR